jgi:hypothetical protein
MSRGDIKSREKRRWRLLDAIGLTKAFTPRLVCETITKDGKGDFEVTATARDGRILGKFKPKSRKDLILHQTKFSSPWSGKRDLKRKAEKLCNLSAVIADVGLPKEAVKPLVRLGAQYDKLGWSNFKKLVKCITSKVVLSSNAKVRQPSKRISRTCCKPSFIRGVQILSDGKVTTPLWGWVPIPGMNPT